MCRHILNAQVLDCSFPDWFDLSRFQFVLHAAGGGLTVPNVMQTLQIIR